MARRGRPPTPDILTSREWQVLDLIRAGLTNPQIADRLGISLSGAKHHVSEIISKLGVESREEAAAWEREPTASRRWAFVPFGLFTAKPAIALTVVASLALGGAGLLTLLAGSPDGLAGTGAQAPTPVLPANCPGCFLMRETEYTTIEEAAVHASFVPMIPAALPAGFEQHRITASVRDYSNPYVPQVHNDWVTIEYRNAAGEKLVISQGFPAMPTAGLFFGSDGAYRDGVLTVNGREAAWSDGDPALPGAEPRLALMLFVGRFASGWEREGSWFSGSPMTYSIASDSLDLDALITIAESVTLPTMLAPLNGATPEPFFD